jgi:[acyl-carrier-protein] S-malonyltransferase
MIAAIFPGQGSQRPGMGKELFLHHESAREVFYEASEATALNLERLCFESDEDTLRQTQNTQIALFVCSVAAYRCLPSEISATVSAMAGHSVGEYAALACAGIVDIATGAKLVKRRGELMANSGEQTPGTMAAILGLDRDQLQPKLDEVDGVVVIANDNCPGQLVISGEVSAVNRACQIATEGGAKRVLPLNVSGAFHSPLMDGPANEMAKLLEETNFKPSAIKVYSNVTAEPGSDWSALLEDQLRQPVRWTETIQNMVEVGVDTFIECGSGEVLSGLIRRIDKSVSTSRVHDESSLANTVHDLSL